MEKHQLTISNERSVKKTNDWQLHEYKRRPATSC